MSMLNPALRGFFEAKGMRNYVLYGGRASSKTYHTAGFCVFLAMNYRVKFLCARQFQNRISDSVKSVIEECIYKLGAQEQFKITETGIEHRTTGASFTFLGIQRNLREIKGIANIDILWIEEAEDLTSEQWEVLEPTVRAEGSKIFIVFNPRLATDFVYQRFVVNPPAETNVRHINFDENPYLSKTMHKVIAAAKAADLEDYNHIYLGQPRENDDAVVIKRAWIMAAVDAHIKLGIKPSGRRRTGFDVADDGGDKNATISAHGCVVQHADEWKGGEDELLKSCMRVYAHALDYGSHINYDSIGVGASAGAKFNELNAARTDGRRVTHAKFNAGGAVHRPDAKYGMTQTANKDHFANIKAQAWWLVADRFRNTYNAVTHGQKFNDDELICIDSRIPHLAKLITELSTPKRDFDANGKVKVESKKDMAKANREGGPVKSPNLGDAFIMAFAPGGDPMKIDQSVINRSKRR